MPTFQYEAMNEAGKQQKGTIQAASSDDAIARIRNQGLFPTSVREQKVKKAKSGAARAAKGSGRGARPTDKRKTFAIGKVKTKMLTTFTRQFSTLQDAGLPILRSLEVLELQQKPGVLKNTLIDVQEDVSGGSTLADAMARHPKAFDRLYCKMIAAGEVAGVLDMILQRLAEFLEKAAKLKARVKSAMIYPIVVIVVAMSIVSLIMLFIVPKFTAIFADFGTSLPGMTLKLMASSNWLGGRLLDDQSKQLIPGILWVSLMPVAFVIFLKLLRKSDIGKALVDRVQLMLPVAGQLIRKTTIARFTRTLGTLIRAGVPILDALIITRDTTGNYVFQKALQGVHDSVRRGDSFAEPLRKARVADPIVANMIDVGEETGDLDKMLLKVADNYDEEVDTAIGGLMSLLEPLIIVLLGGIVMFIVVALFLPLVKLIQSVSG